LGRHVKSRIPNTGNRMTPREYSLRKTGFDDRLCEVPVRDTCFGIDWNETWNPMSGNPVTDVNVRKIISRLIPPRPPPIGIAARLGKAPRPPAPNWSGVLTGPHRDLAIPGRLQLFPSVSQTLTSPFLWERSAQ